MRGRIGQVMRFVRESSVSRPPRPEERILNTAPHEPRAGVEYRKEGIGSIAVDGEGAAPRNRF